jgi:hypothetical protein
MTFLLVVAFSLGFLESILSDYSLIFFSRRDQHIILYISFRFPTKSPRNMNSSIGNTGSCHVPQNGLRLLSLVSLLRSENHHILSSTQHQLPLVQGPPLSRAEHRKQLLCIINAALALLEEDWDVESLREDRAFYQVPSRTSIRLKLQNNLIPKPVKTLTELFDHSYITYVIYNEFKYLIICNILTRCLSQLYLQVACIHFNHTYSRSLSTLDWACRNSLKMPD